MQFVFNGTLEELKSTIRTKAQALNKDIVVYHNDPNTLEIGFQRLGHSGGRFFVANVTETDTAVFLQGKLVDIYSGEPESNPRRFWSLLGTFVMFYILIELVLQILWLPIFHFSHIWIPLILPLPAFIFLRVRAIREEKKIDADFIAFMTTFAAKFCPYLNEYIDEGCCYDLQMICDGYIKDSALPEVKVDKTQLSKQCQKCRIR